MLQYPINVRPENIAISPNTDGDTSVSFTFQGDSLAFWAFRVYDCSTGEVVYTSNYSGADGFTPRAYNGDTVVVDSQLGARSFLESSHNYVVQFLMSQRTRNGQTNVYDIPCLSGTITSVSTTTHFILEKNLPIYEWNVTQSGNLPTTISNELVVGMIIKIKDEERLITSYNSETGEIVLSQAFSFTVTNGMRYKIFSNYLITPQYYFMCRTIPTITSTIQISDSGGIVGLECSANYYQPDNSMIKYFVAKLYASFHDLDEWYELDTTPKIYNQNIVYKFRYAFLGVTPWTTAGYGNEPHDVDYKVEFEIVTQDNDVFTSEAIMRLQSTDDSFIKPYYDIVFKPNRDTGCVDIVTYPRLGSNASAMIWRTDLITGKSERLYETRHDYKVSSNGKYRYKVLYYDPTSYRPYVKYDEDGNNVYADNYDINTEFDGYIITALTPISTSESGTYYNKIQYKTKTWYHPEETWHLMCDIEDTTMEHNYDKHLQVGYGQYPAMTSTYVNYLTGTLTGSLGQIDCITKQFNDDLARVQAWRKFISQSCPFMLKSSKGDIWIVNITSANTSYDEKTIKKYTTFSFSWAECDSIENAIIYRGTNY